MIRYTAMAAFAAAVAIVVTVLAGPASGYFATSGFGAGTAATGTLKPLTILLVTAGSNEQPLYPDGTGDVTLNVKNPNDRAVTITSVSQAGGITVQGADGCTSDPGWPATTGNSGVTLDPVEGLSIEIAGHSTEVVYVADAASMHSGSSSQCQGAVFQIPVRLEVRQ